MTTSKRAWEMVGALLVLGCALPGFGRSPIDPVPGETAIEEASDPTLPYSGYGRVAILDDGMVLITLGGEFRTDPAREESGMNAEVGVSASTALAYQMDTSGMALAQYQDDEVFLDRNGTEIARRGFAPERVIRTSFGRAEGSETGPNRFVLLSLKGQLRATFDTVEKALTVAITDQESGRKFSFTGVVAATREARPLLKTDPRVMLSPPSVSLPSHCEFSCAKGSGEYTCLDRGCAGYCDKGTPVGTCFTTVQ